MYMYVNVEGDKHFYRVGCIETSIGVVNIYLVSAFHTFHVIMKLIIRSVVKIILFNQ